MNCPFCKISAEKTERLITETPFSFSVLSNPRLMPGHLLVIPKRHVGKFSELSEEERADLFSEAIRLQDKILEKVASGCDMTEHFRPFIPQSRLKVDHLHIHLRPREFKDELYQKVQVHETEMFTDIAPDEFAKYRAIFSKAM